MFCVADTRHESILQHECTGGGKKLGVYEAKRLATVRYADDSGLLYWDSGVHEVGVGVQGFTRSRDRIDARWSRRKI